MLRSARKHLTVIYISCALVAAASVAARAAVLPDQIDADMTLTEADSPWEMRSDVVIDASVTVEPNVRVVAQGNYRLTVRGSLTAMSPAGTRIVFRAPDNASSGVWKGLYFTRDAVGRFQRCTFRSARDNLLIDNADVRLYNCHVRRASRDGLMAWGDAFVKCAYCRFQNNGRYGVQIQTNNPDGAIIFSEFVGNGEHPLRVKASCLEMLHRGNTFDYNGVQAIGVDCDALSDIEDVDCWRRQDVPLDMTVGSDQAELIIEQDAVLRIKSGVRIYPPRRIVVRGSLFVSGLTGAPIVIQPKGEGTPGEWLGIALEPGGLARIDVATVGFARDGFSVDDANLFVSHALIRDCEENGIFAGGSSHVDLADCTISACGRNGVAIPQATSTAKIHSTRVVECGSYPMRLGASVVEALRHDNTWRDNARSAIGVVCSDDPDIEDDDAWLPQGIPFDLTADPDARRLHVAAGARLSLRPGVEVVGGAISADGVLVASGEPSNPVTFGSPAEPPAPGDWTGIEFAPGSAGRLVNAVVRHAQIGVNVQSDGWIQIIDTRVSDCAEDGIRVAGSSTPVITGCRVTSNTRWGVSVWHNAFPLMGQAGNANNPGGNILTDNGEYDLANQTPNPVLAQRNWWGSTDETQIGARILDSGEEADLGPVNFVPFLNSQPAATVTAASDSRPLAVVSVAAMPTGMGAAISVRLSRPAEVRATVRNIAGRPVRELCSGVQSQGVITWNARDARGNRVPPGTYLIEVEAFAEDGRRCRALTHLTLGR